MSLRTGYEWKLSAAGRRSTCKKRNATYTVAFMVCAKVQPIHLERAAAADRLETSAAADADHAAGLRRSAALQPGIVDFPAVRRADVMDRALEAHSGPATRAAITRNGQGAVFHMEYARGLRAELHPREARLYAGAVQAGANFGSSNIGAVPNALVLCSAIHKTLNIRARQRRAQQVANVFKRLGGLRGPAGSPRV